MCRCPPLAAALHSFVVAWRVPRASWTTLRWPAGDSKEQQDHQQLYLPVCGMSSNAKGGGEGHEESNCEGSQMRRYLGLPTLRHHLAVIRQDLAG